MIRRFLFIIIGCISLGACGDESQSNRTGDPSLVDAVEKPNDDKKHSAQSETEKNTELEAAKEKAAKLEAQGYTNNGSPLTAITLSQGASIIPVNAQTFWLATGLYEDESERDLTELVVWGTTNAAVLSLLADDPGGVKGASTGNANVTAELGTMSTSAPLTIIP